MRNGKPFTLRVRLALLVLVAVAPAFGFIAYSAWQQRGEAFEAARQEALRLARHATAEQARLFEQTRELLARLAQQPEARRVHSLNQCTALLADLKALYPYYANLGVIRTDGAVLCSSVPTRGSVNLADRAYFRRALQTREFAVGDYQIGRITGRATVNLAYPALDPSGQVQFVLFAALDLSWLNELMKNASLPADTVVSIVDSNGIVLARFPDPDAWVGKQAPEMGLFPDRDATGRETVVEAVDADGVRRVHLLLPLNTDGSNNAYVRVTLSNDIAYASVNRRFLQGLLVMAGVALLVIGVALAGGALFVLRPIKAIAAAAGRLAEGDLSARTNLHHGEDELGRLVRTFDEMAAVLESRQRLLEFTANERARTNQALKTVSAGNRALLHAKEELPLLQEICRVAVEVGGYKFAWVGYAGHDPGKTIRPVAFAGTDDGFLDSLSGATWADGERGRGLAATAIRTGKRSAVRDAFGNPDLAVWRELLARHGFSSGIAFPLRVHGEVIGAFSIYSGETGAFDEREVAILSENADDLAFGIETLRERRRHAETEARVHYLAFHDTLTGLANRTSLEEALAKLVAPGSGNRSVALLAINVDRFREINDALGHEAGDALLKALGERLQRLSAADSVIARMGADEFALLMPQASLDDAEVTAHRVLHAVSLPFPLSDLTVDVHASIGIAMFPDHAKDSDLLIRRAMSALLEARKSGRAFGVFHGGAEPDNRRRLALITDLRRAIDGRELTLHFQPKVEIRTRRIVGCESLARWRHPEHGMISPGEFIPLAEHTGLIRQLTYLLFEQALRQAKDARAHGLDIRFAVNLSARNLRDPRLLDRIGGSVEATGVQPHRIELELTESALMDDPAHALEILTRLHDMGFELHIDDFGTGYSSLGYLQKLPVDAVKIDRAFVSAMTRDSGSEVIVRSTVDLAHNLGLKVIAEGVEDRETLERLEQLGCDVAQGYHISRPLPWEDFMNWQKQSQWSL